MVAFVGLIAVCGWEGRAEDNGLFVRANVGANLLHDFVFDDVPGVTQEFDPGMRADATVGYTFYSTPSVALAGAGEFGFLYNSLSKAKGPAGTVSTEGDFVQVPFLAKLIATFNPDAQWTPFVGVGGGGIYARMDVHKVGSTVVDTWSDETDPAAQAEAGVTYKIGDRMAIGLEYKFTYAFSRDVKDFYNHSIGFVFSTGF